MNRVLSGTALIAVAVLLFAGGCSSGSRSLAPLAPALNPPLFGEPAGWPSAAQQGKPILFVADLQGNIVRMYDPTVANPMAEGSITAGVHGPQGLAVDSKGQLYVSNVGSTTGSITVYSPGKTKPHLSIPGPGYYGIAVDSKGDIFASFTGGTVSAFKPGAKKPYETIGGFDDPAGIAIDSKNNVWVADTSASKIWMIPAGTKTVKDSGLKGIDGPVGIAFGLGDVLYVANFGPYNVTVYKAGSKEPAYHITDGITGPTMNGVTAGGAFFQSNQQHDVVGYKKGRGVPFSTIVGNSDPLGIASSPLVKK